jgi:acetoin utilization deacetylase AcuC-like enzyme
MELSSEGFAALATIVRVLAEELCGGRVALVLEGGYALSGLREGTDRVLEALTAPAPHPLPPEIPLTPNSHLNQLVTRVTQAHASHLLRRG